MCGRESNSQDWVGGAGETWLKGLQEGWLLPTEERYPGEMPFGQAIPAGMAALKFLQPPGLRQPQCLPQ